MPFALWEFLPATAEGREPDASSSVVISQRPISRSLIYMMSYTPSHVRPARFYRTPANQSQFFQPHRDPIPESSAFFRCWRIAGRRLLPTLQALLCSSVLLLQLSRLLLVFLLQLLPPRIIRPHLRQPLVVLLLFLLELASLLFLARLELLLVSLVFLVQLRVSCVGKAR